MFIGNRFRQFISIVVILTILLSIFSWSGVSAQGTDGLKREINAETGKVSFISPESGQTLSAARALGATIRAQDPSLALAKRFGPEFGLKNPQSDLTELKSERSSDGRVITRYQQDYQGIPVIGGELIVNTNDSGDLYSINGEVSTDLALSSQPSVTMEQAKQTALEGVAKWYEKTAEDFVATEPALWVFDEHLLRPSSRPAELVWRLEVKPKDAAVPVRELVLVDAQRGSISLHFNQTDTAWSAKTVHASTDAALNGTSVTRISGNMPALAGATFYVATTGSNTNACNSLSSPCKTINNALSKATAGDTIRVAAGTYTGTGNQVVNIGKNIILSGGWNKGFTAQSGMSTINGQNARRGILIGSGKVVILDHFMIQNGKAIDLGPDGGGILNWGGDLTVDNSSFENNAGTHGGAINNQGSLTVSNSVFNNNSASNDGGGIYHSGSSVNVNNSTFSGNSAAIVGGALYSQGTTLTLNNSTISGNTANQGGGIYTTGSGVTLLSTTVSNNIAAAGGGGMYLFGGTTSLANTIIAGNITGGVAPDCNAVITSLGYNLVGNNLGCAFNATTGDLVGTSSNPINPYLAPLRDNGGPTFTLALMTGSPAIDAGSPAVLGSGSNSCPVIDQRGFARPIGGRCDIGAYEGSVPFVVQPSIMTFTAGNTPVLPGTLLCNQAQANCTNGSDPTADAAHKFAIGTYNFYAAQFNRTSIDNNNLAIVSSVHYCSDYNVCPFDNAFWNGQQMIYGDANGYALADDVVAHELTHGVTQFESNLFYYYQSGAINESFSDLWGEYYDQTNNQGTDTAAVKWKIGEDIGGLGAIRDMKNPGAFGDPDKMSSPNYYEGEADNGGVHQNSGVNNKAVTLMVDGGSFNGKTVTALGWPKTAAIYYEANTNLLSSGADYSDLYYALQQACSNLIGQKSITAGDCTEVKDALDAVEMNGQPALNFNADAPFCDTGSPVNTLFSDGLESGTGNWNLNIGTTARWQLDSPYGSYAHSGTHFLYADDSPAELMQTGAQLTPLAVPNNAYLYFAQAYDFEVSSKTGDLLQHTYDGGVLEYSADGGSTWLDAGSLMDFNGYTGTIFPNFGNPLAGRSGFVGSSHGYIGTRLNLAALAGQTVSFRWLLGTDSSVTAWGWWLDDVKLYQCPVAAAGKATLVAPSGSVTVSQPTYTWNEVSTATWYYLSVNGPSGNVFQTWYTSAQAGCNGTICSITPALSLSAGAYTWQVETWNAAGLGPWSDPMTFNFTPPPPPGKATLILPTGNLTLNTPTYTWNVVNNSTWYYLWVDGPSGNVIKTWYTSAQANCNSTTCSVTPTTTLGTGTYTWWIQTWNPGGPGPWSDATAFSIIPTPLPGKATLVLPNGNTNAGTPTYTWNEVSDSTWYYLWVDGPSGNVIKTWYTSAQANCNSTTCSVTPTTTLGTGTYTWWIQTWNPGGPGPWSDATAFSIIPTPLPGKATLVLPNGNTNAGTPTYTWNEVSDSTWYYLWVDGPSGNVIKTWYTSAQANCNGTTCSVTPTTTLGTGTYTWWIQTWNPGGPGPWSDATNFSIP